MELGQAARPLWGLDPAVAFLNHGSFGACPLPVLEEQQRLRAVMERQPVDFFTATCFELIALARKQIAEFLGAPAAGQAVGGLPELLVVAAGRENHGGNPAALSQRPADAWRAQGLETRGGAMPLGPFEREVLRLIAGQRNPESYVAGAAARGA